MNNPLRWLLRRHTSLSPAIGSASVNRGARACACCRRAGWRCGRPEPDRRRARAWGRARRAAPPGFRRTGLRQPIAGADLHRQPHDRIVLRLPMHLGQHGVGLGVGEEAAALNGRQLRRIAEHQHRHAKRHQVAASSASTIEHSSITMSLAFEAGASSHSSKLGVSSPLSRARRSGCGWWRRCSSPCCASPRRLAGKGREQHLAVDAFGDVLASVVLPVPA